MSDTPAPAAVHPPAALPPGTRLGEFELRHVLGVGGFAIVYLAFDHQLEREVALKEYMPTMLAGRTETLHVSLRSQGDAETFALGLKSFVNEARLLARFDLPSLVRVHRFWEENGTAYMAMPVVRGQSAKAWRQAQGHPPDEAWLRALLTPLLDTLEKLHVEAVYHRDIAPDNIQIDEDGRPVLLDLGAARRVIGDATQTLTAILKPAYAPIEQYAEVGALRQGPWTDLYALGATLHYLLLGHPPLPATARALHDELPPLAGQAVPGVSLRFLQIVDWLLSPRPQDRPQSVDVLRQALQGEVTPPERAQAQAAPPAQWERTQKVAGVALNAADDLTVVTGGSARAAKLDIDPAEPVATAAAASGVDAAAPASAPTASEASPVPQSAPKRPPQGVATAPDAAPERRSRTPVLAGVAGLLVAAVAAGLWFSGGTEAAGPATATVAVGQAAPVSAQASAPDTVLAGTAPASAATTVALLAGAAAAGQAALPQPAAGGSTQVSTPDLPSTGATPAADAARDIARDAARPATATPPVRRTPVQTRPTPAPQPPVLETAPPPAPVVEPPPVQAAVPRTPASSPPLAAAKPEPLPLKSPTERCGRRVLIALWNCIDRQCREPELRNHPECVKLREDRERSVRGRF